MKAPWFNRRPLTARIVRLGLCSLLGWVLARGTISSAQAEAPRGTEAITFTEMTDPTHASIRKGLAFLASTQQDDGSWGGGAYNRHVGITAIAAMAFLADGHLPGRGKYGDNVEAGLEFVLRHGTESGLLAADTSHGPMYGHGFATLFLGEIYGMTGDERVREPLLKAVRLIVKSQNHQGGWRYHPIPYDADISVTICQIMALRSAREAGLAVPKDTIDAAIQYVKNCQNPADGGFRYMIGNGSSGYARTAAGVSSLFYAGVYEGPTVERGLRYMDRTPVANSGGHFYYGHYYAAQAMFLAGGEHWRQYYPQIRQLLVSRQQSNGSWSGGHGEPYCTGMSLLILQVPNRLLPIYQR